jgi:hypothetical protein
VPSGFHRCNSTAARMPGARASRFVTGDERSLERLGEGHVGDLVSRYIFS